MNSNRSNSAPPRRQEKAIGSLLVGRDLPATFQHFGPGRFTDQHGLPCALRPAGTRGRLGDREGSVRRSLTRSAPSPTGSRRSNGIVHSALAAALISLCLFTALGCSSDRSRVEEVAMQWVDGIKNGNAETLEKIIDWELWYSVYSKSDAPGDESGGAGPPTTSGLTDEEQDYLEYQKSLLLAVLSTDKLIASQYLTAVNEINRVSIKGDEALAEIAQDDRTSGERRRIILQMHKDPGAGWRIYSFRKEDLEEV